MRKYLRILKVLIKKSTQVVDFLPLSFGHTSGRTDLCPLLCECNRRRQVLFWSFSFSYFSFFFCLSAASSGILVACDTIKYPKGICSDVVGVGWEVLRSLWSRLGISHLLHFPLPIYSGGERGVAQSRGSPAVTSTGVDYSQPPSSATPPCPAHTECHCAWKTRFSMLMGDASHVYCDSQCLIRVIGLTETHKMYLQTSCALVFIHSNLAFLCQMLS